MYILSRSSSSPSSCLVSSRLVSFLSIFFNPRPLARRCVFKIGLDENPSESYPTTYIVYRTIVHRRDSSRFRFQEDPAKRKEREDPSLLLAIDQISHTPHVPRDPIGQSANAIRLHHIPIFVFAPIVFSSLPPPLSPLIRPTISLFPPMEVIERLDILHERQNHRSKREGRSRNCAWQLLIRDLLRFLLSQTRFVSYQNGANKD